MKKFLSIMLSILMVVTMIPFAFAAASADGDDLAISGSYMSSSTPYLASGSKEATATKPETGYAYWDAASNTLTLNNFTSATDAATGIFYDGSAETLRIELVGNNSVTGGTGAVAHSGVRVNSDTDIIFSGGGTLTLTGTGTGTGNGGGYGVFAWGDITVDSGTTLIATGSSFQSGVNAEDGSIIVNAGGSLTGSSGESGGSGVSASSITVNGGSLIGNSEVSHGVYANSITVSGNSHILATGGNGNYISVGTLDGEYYSYSGDGTDKTFAHSTDAPLTGTVTETYFELVTAQHLSDTYTSNGDATHSRYCSCALHTKVTAPEACSGGTATCAEQAKCEHCGASYGELDADGHDWSNKDGVCANGCGEVCPHEKYTDGVCDKCGYECPHEWDEGVLTRPVYDAVLGSKDGYYTYTCAVCGKEKKETVKSADYSAYEAVSVEINTLLQSDELTFEAKQEIYSAAIGHGLLSNDLTESEQNKVDDLVAELEKIIADAEEKIASGEYVKADYTEIDEAIDDIEEKLASENVTDEGKAELEEIKKQLEEMKADENTSVADVAELEKALEDYEEELDKGIEDGTLVMVDGDKIAVESNKKFAEKLEAEGLTDEYEDFIYNQKATDEAFAAEKEMIDFANSLEGTVAENAENIAKLNEMLDSLYSSFENCLRGTHNFKDYEITSPAKCEVNAIETGTCWFCGETDEREVEGSALEHSFTKYEEVTAPKCGVAGKEVSYCDNGCQTTDERETPPLEHIFLDYVSNGDATCTADGTKTASCIHGCGATDTVADEGSKLDHTDEDGDKLCDDCGSEAYDRCDICGGKAHGDDKIQLLFCMIITIIRFVTSILKSIN